MAFWDGNRWITRQPPPPRSDSVTIRDWIATALMIAVLVGALVPIISSQAGGPTLSVRPGEGTPGTAVVVEGRFFSPRSRIGLTFAQVTDSPVRVNVGRDGTFRYTVAVPDLAPGAHTLQAVDTTSRGGRAVARALILASVGFTILATDPVTAAIAPSIPPEPVPTAATPVPFEQTTSVPSPSGDVQANVVPPTPPPATPPPPAATPPPTPAPTVAPAPPAPRATGSVSVCGRSLCAGGARWYLYGASILGGMDDPATAVSRAAAAGLNTVRVVNFLDEHGAVGSAEFNEWHWARLDRVIAAAGGTGLKVILDLSTHRNLIANAGRNPYTHDWTSFIQFAANRRNTVTGVRYGDDQTIALIAFAGEVEPLKTPDNTLGITTAQVTSFFQKAFATWKQHDRLHPVSSGGLLHYGWDSGIDWRAIFAAADVCSIHNYSDGDISATPGVAAYCASLGKPWITEEFGWERGIGDAARAARFQQMYALQANNGSAGVAFWNMGGQTSSPTFDVNSSTPLTLDVVFANAP
jgi:hypothetical protein